MTDAMTTRAIGEDPALEVAAIEKVEAELNHFIERRAKGAKKENGEEMIGHGLAAGSERRAAERPNGVCARLVYEILQTHMPNEKLDLSAARVR